MFSLKNKKKLKTLLKRSGTAAKGIRPPSVGIATIAVGNKTGAVQRTQNGAIIMPAPIARSVSAPLLELSTPKPIEKAPPAPPVVEEKKAPVYTIHTSINARQRSNAVASIISGFGRQYVVALERDGSVVYAFGMDAAGTPYCCGLREVGNFVQRTYSADADISQKVSAVRALFEQLYTSVQTTTTRPGGEDDEENDQIDSRINFIFTTVQDSDVCNMVVEAVSGLSNQYQELLDFVNSNSGNNNTLWSMN